MKKVLYISFAAFLVTLGYQFYFAYAPISGIGVDHYFDLPASMQPDSVLYTQLILIASVLGMIISSISITIQKRKKENHAS